MTAHEAAVKMRVVEQYDIKSGGTIQDLRFTAAFTDELHEQKTQLIAYLLSKVKAGDWHACADAAMDIREIEAKLSVLGA